MLLSLQIVHEYVTLCAQIIFGTLIPGDKYNMKKRQKLLPNLRLSDARQHICLRKYVRLMHARTSHLSQRNCVSASLACRKDSIHTPTVPVTSRFARLTCSWRRPRLALSVSIHQNRTLLTKCGQFPFCILRCLFQAYVTRKNWKPASLQFVQVVDLESLRC